MIFIWISSNFINYLNKKWDFVSIILFFLRFFFSSKENCLIGWAFSILPYTCMIYRLQRFWFLFFLCRTSFLVLPKRNVIFFRHDRVLLSRGNMRDPKFGRPESTQYGFTRKTCYSASQPISRWAQRSENPSPNTRTWKPIRKSTFPISHHCPYQEKKTQNTYMLSRLGRVIILLKKEKKNSSN